MAKKYTVTMAIPYVNAHPHIGHSIELLAADTVARYHRLLGEEVRFVTGTDEHGLKVARAAEKAGVDPLSFATQTGQKFKDWIKIFKATPDIFVRTTDPDHIKVAQEVWRRADKNGDIEKRTYKASYCVGCEAVLTLTELTTAGLCCIHGTKPEIIEEENYFFKLSK